MKGLEKKIFYFLLAGDENLVHSVSKKKVFFLDEKKSFPAAFLSFSKRTFNKKKPIFSSSFFVWKKFCQACSYEECLPIILHFIFKYPKKQISYLLSLPLEDVSYRLTQGLFLLEDQIKLNSDPLFLEYLKKNKNRLVETKKALLYLDFLSLHSLPKSLSNLPHKIPFASSKYFFILKIFFSVGIISLLVYFVFLYFFSTSFSPIILYP